MSSSMKVIESGSTRMKLPRELWRRHWIVLAIMTLLMLPLPLLLGPAEEPVAIRILIFMLMSIGWNVMSGFGGMFSFGHAAYFGIGGYTTAWLLVNNHVSPWVGMAVGALLAMVFAVIIGFLALRYRLKGAYFALATMAFAEMLRLWAINADFVHRAEGFHVPLLTSDSWLYLQFAPDSPNYFWIALALVVIALAVTLVFLRSKLGRYCVAVRDDEEAAGALGLPVMRIKLQTMALSAAITAVAGALFVQYYMFIDPALAFGSAVSIQSILPAVIGGVSTIWGPVIGSLILGPLNELTAGMLRNPPPFLTFLQGRAGLDVIVYGLLLIAIVLLMPKGIYGTVRDRVRRR